MRGGGHTPQLTVFEKNVVRGLRDSASRLRLLLFFFFQIEKRRNAPTVGLDRGHGGRDVAEASSCRPGTLFFSFFHKHTLVKSVADRFLVLHRRCD